MQSGDFIDLERFVSAQELVFENAMAELRAGRKRSHWMWFIFPQMRGLGRSTTAEFYGIASRGEAEAYLEHPLLAGRLRDATEAVLAHRHTDAHDIFASPDYLKFRSSMTLFVQIDPSGPYHTALEVFFAGDEDQATIRLLGASPSRR